MAWVVTEGDVEDSDLKAYLAKSFPRFWLPDAFIRVPAVPKTSVGKIDKAQMRRAHVAGEV